ncbi:hypothetical protein ABZP36_008069 [Zizania latifolia]
MDFHTLPRCDLQALCKRNGVRANMTNAAMAEALAALSMVDGIEEFVTQPAALPSAATKAAVKAVVEEALLEKQGSPLPRSRRVTVRSPEIIRLNDSNEEVKQEAPPEEIARTPPARGRRGTVRSSQLIRLDDGEKEKQDMNRDANEAALSEVRRGASRRARAAPVAALSPPTTRSRARARKIEPVDVVAEAPTSTVPTLTVEKVSRGRRTTGRSAARMPRIQLEDEEGNLQGVVSDVESTSIAPVSDAGPDDAVEVDMKTLGLEKNSAPEESVQEEEGVEGEASEETVEKNGAVAHRCLSEVVVEKQEVDVEQPLSLDDSPIIGVVSGTVVEEGEEAPVCDSECSMGMLLSQEIRDITSEDKDAMTADEVPQATVTCSEATLEAELPIDAGRAIEELEVVNETGVVAEDNGAETADKPHDKLTDDADNTIQLDFSAEANSLSCAVEKEVVVVTEDILQSSATMKDDLDSEIFHADEHNYLVTVERASSDKEDISQENVFTDSLSTSVIAAEATVSETIDMSSDCMQSSSSSNDEQGTELVANEDENKVKVDRQKEPVELAELSLRILKAKLKEKLIANKLKEEERVALARLDENVN